MKGSVFISYRRDDSEDITGRIHDHLEGLIDRESLFRDVDNIPPGVRFDNHLNDALQNCGLVLAIIGPDWVTQRLSQPQDHLRLEIEFALRRDIPIIPVLVRGADIPTASQIPESLANLVLYNGIEIRSDGGFKSSVKSLAKAIQTHIAEPPTDAAPKKLNLSPIWRALNKATRVEDYQKLASKLKAAEKKYPHNEEIRELKQQVNETLTQQRAKSQAKEVERLEIERQAQFAVAARKEREEEVKRQAKNGKNSKAGEKRTREAEKEKKRLGTLASENEKKRLAAAKMIKALNYGAPFII